RCPALTVSRLVETLPNTCVTSQVDINARCSFSCPQGYQLQGPSYKNCESSGQWTDNRTVSCIEGISVFQLRNLLLIFFFSDINECAVSKGGCSHKCVNTAGGYKCECPDPELNLSSDNKTCYALGVNVQCNSENMTIIIPKSLLLGMIIISLNYNEKLTKL
ncbi:unnamed protein product, partial [Porites evermanni]